MSVEKRLLSRAGSLRRYCMDWKINTEIFILSSDISYDSFSNGNSNSLKYLREGKNSFFRA